MGIAVTKEGNFYNKTHAGTIAGGAAGAIAGAAYAAENAEKIERASKEYIKDIQKEILKTGKDKIKKTGEILNDTFNGQKSNVDTLTEDLEKRIYKKWIKAANYFRNNSIKCLSIAGGIAGAIVVGSAINCVINKCRAHNADKHHNAQNLSMEKIIKKM